MLACRLVVFDFDGTLAETRVAVSTTLNHVLADAGLPRVEPRAVHGRMGLPLERLIDHLLPPTMKPYDVTPLVAGYREHFDQLGGPHVQPLPGAVEVVGALRERGVATAIATSRESSSLAPLLERFGLADAFDSVVTCDRVPVGKPDPGMLRLVASETGVAPADTWMVGDTTYDVEMARAADVRIFGVAHGSHPADLLVEAGAELLEGLLDLLDLVDG